MRVIAGSLGGRRLRAPRGAATRPTSDRVREALFSTLGDVRGARVLDLFAGSGALAIEALSRGAAEATLVDSSAAAVRVIRANLEALSLHAEVRRRDWRPALREASAAGRQYDLVLLDPPYRLAAAIGDELTTALAPVLAAGGRVASESATRAPLRLGLPLTRERRHGDTTIRIHDTQ